MVRMPGFHCHGPGSIPGQGAEIPQATRRGKKKKKIANVMLQVAKFMAVIYKSLMCGKY